MQGVLRHLRQTVLQREVLSDGQLLQRYLTAGDDAAFAEIVRRHGAMVLGLCRRILRNEHDAEDAFQAVFLVLVRKAASIWPRHKVGHWLYGVAYRTALKAKGKRGQIGAREGPLVELPATPPSDTKELRQVLDLELSRLAVHYRLPILLCDLQGLTRKETAQRLGWPEGTVATRLHKARAVLARRLARHGVMSTGAALPALMATEGQASVVPSALVDSVAKTIDTTNTTQISSEVLSLTQEVMQTMMLSKIKLITTVLMVLVLTGVGVALLWHPAGAEGEPQFTKKQTRKKNQTPPYVAAKKEKDSQPKEVGLGLLPPGAKIKLQWSGGIAERHAAIKALNSDIDVALLQRVPSLKLIDFVRFLGQEIMPVVDGKKTRIVIDVKNFVLENPDAPDVRDTEVTFVYQPSQMPLVTVLRHALSFVPTKNATFIVRRGIIVITTADSTLTPVLLRNKVVASFDDVPVREALLELAANTGAHIQLDPRCKEKLNEKVTAAFANNVTLGSALRMLTNMTGLEMVEMGEGIYVTTPENAKSLQEKRYPSRGGPAKDDPNLRNPF